MEKTITEVNAMIDAVLLLVREDVSCVTSMLRDHSAEIERSGHLQHLIVYTQSFDVFEQKSHHVVTVNNAAIRSIIGSIGQREKNDNVFKLNSLQYQLAWHDYSGCMQALKEITSSRAFAGYNVPCMVDFVSGRAIIESAVRKVIQKFRQLFEETAGDPGLVAERHKGAFSAIYSTWEERHLLEMFCRDSALTIEKILNDGVATPRTSSIELF